MLGTLVAAVNAVQSGLVYALYGSYKTGFILVSFLKTVFAYFNFVLDNLLAILVIFGESLTIFLQDIFQYIQNLYNFILTTYEVLTTNAAALIQGICSIIASVISAIAAFYNGLFNAFCMTVTNFGQLFVITKKFIVLLGSGIWFAVTLIPLLLFYFMKLSLTLVQELMLEIYHITVNCVSNLIGGFRNAFFFVIDVPVESLFGLLIALSLIYIFVQFYVLMHTYSHQLWRKIKFTLIRLKTRIITSLQEYSIGYQTIQWPNRPAIRNVPQTPSARRRNLHQTPRIDKRSLNSDNTEEKLCVICQERNKCVLLLPCRHVCLCNECNRELRYYNDVCPICRSDIESTMKIFV